MKISSRDKHRMIHLEHYANFLSRKADANPDNAYVIRDLHCVKWAIEKLKEYFGMEKDESIIN